VTAPTLLLFDSFEDCATNPGVKAIAEVLANAAWLLQRRELFPKKVAQTHDRGSR
jgi:hypothetical protein